jgi:hypothetical protein
VYNTFDVDTVLTCWFLDHGDLCPIHRVHGPGTDANHRSHWAFAIHRKTAESGVLLHVQLIDLSKLIYQYDERRGVDVRSRSSEGSFEVGSLKDEQVQQAVKVIRDEAAPKDGVEKCQDWVLRAIISLEAEEIVPPGTSEWIGTLVGQAATTVAQAAGNRWVRTVTH